MAFYGHNTLYRYHPPTETLPVPRVELPFRILALFANPTVFGLPPLDVQRERAVMEHALAPLTDIQGIELVTLEHATISDMVEALASRRINIFYYQGHVGFNAEYRSSYLLLEGWGGEAATKEVQLLSNTLRQTNVSLAIVNSEGMAAGSVAYEMVERGFPTVVATQEPLSDEETTTLTIPFYAFGSFSCGFPIYPP